MLHNLISPGPVSGEYQAFPDSCRLRNGDIVAVFYAGYGHVSFPNEDYPKGGRICLTRSCDEGGTWSEPVTIHDDEYDNRDPHIAELSNGTLICSFFSVRGNLQSYEVINTQLIRSTDGGETWEPEGQSIQTENRTWISSAPIRELKDGTCLLPLYHQSENEAYGGVMRSHDFGDTWSHEIPIGQDSGLFLPAETDIIQLADGTLYAALRGAFCEHMRYATSPDQGLTWSEVKDIGFEAHAPHFNRLKSGEILLACRGLNPDHSIVNTALYVSRDECRSWLGPYTIDDVSGAYPSTVELNDGSILAIYYEEGPNSAVRARRFRLPSLCLPQEVPFLAFSA